jgi:hypothetical protein
MPFENGYGVLERGAQGSAYMVDELSTKLNGGDGEDGRSECSDDSENTHVSNEESGREQDR